MTLNKAFIASMAVATMLVGCSQDVSRNEEISADSELVFQRKTECAKYLKDAEKKAEEYGKEIAGDRAMYWPNMERVFYSPKVNSCVFVWSNNTVEADESGTKNRVDRGLNDILSGEELIREIYIQGDTTLGDETKMTERFSQRLAQFE